jgi:hypothetical protein
VTGIGPSHVARLRFWDPADVTSGTSVLAYE